jgi:hypothetical protein
MSKPYLRRSIHKCTTEEFCLLGYNAVPWSQPNLRGLHGIISQKTELFITTAVRASNSTWMYCCSESAGLQSTTLQLSYCQQTDSSQSDNDHFKSISLKIIVLEYICAKIFTWLLISLLIVSTGIISHLLADFQGTTWHYSPEDGSLNFTLSLVSGLSNSHGMQLTRASFNFPNCVLTLLPSSFKRRWRIFFFLGGGGDFMKRVY